MGGAVPIQIQPADILGTTQPIDKMIKQVARVFGNENDPEAKANALDYLDRAADRMNMWGVYLFARRVKEYSIAAADIADGDTTFDFPADFAWPTDQCTAEDTAGELVGQPQWLAWEDFQRLGRQDANSSVPQALSYPNELGSSTSPESTIDGKIHVFPAFGSGDFDKLTVAYFARIPRPSEVFDAENIRILPEAREAMLTSAVALAAQTRHLTKPNIWVPMLKEAEGWFTRAKAAAQRQQAIFRTFIIPIEVGRQVTGNRGRRYSALIRI